MPVLTGQALFCGMEGGRYLNPPTSRENAMTCQVRTDCDCLLREPRMTNTTYCIEHPKLNFDPSAFVNMDNTQPITLLVIGHSYNCNC